MNENNAIEVRNMSKSFKVQYDKAHSIKELLIRHNKGKVEKHEVLKNINLDIKKGDVVGLIGVNGSGKSTLLKLMTKIIYPTSGTVETNGKLTSLLELGAGFHPDFTGRENIYFNAAIFGLNQKEIDARINDIIEFSELGEAIDEPIRTYSSGMYMRLAFSIAINVDAEILLIDEILAVGDQHFQDKCYAKLRELKVSDKTIVIVSHSLNVVKDLCTRCIWIYQGEVRDDGDPVYVINNYLKQVAKEHKEKKQKAIEAGEDSYRGAICIDTPKNFSHLSADRENIHISGWKVTDCEKSKLVIKVGNQEVNDIQFIPRKDVFEVYEEEYNGFINTNDLGWQVNINKKDFAKELSQDRELKISVDVLDEKNNLITEKEVSVFLDEEA